MENYLVRCLKNSGASLTVQFNPFHWKVVPDIFYQRDIWHNQTFNLNFLFFYIKIWLDEDMAI
jgi:hypothetical protein